MIKKWDKSTWLITAFVIETFCVTYGLTFGRFIPLFAILYFISGMAIAILWLFYKEAKLSIKPTCHFGKTNNIYRFIIMGTMALMMFQFGNRWFQDNPLNFHDADMLPIMKVMATRFVNGHWKQVYDVIPEIWGGSKPMYLPAMWLPFAIPALLQVDIRWMSVFILFVCFSYCIWLIKPAPRNNNIPLIIIAACTLFYWLFTNEASGLVPYTEESVVVGYYVLLTIALLNGNIWFIGIAISLCALSRYALIGFIPAFLLYLVLLKQYKSSFKLITIGISCFLLLFLIPFGWGELVNLLKLPSAYIAFAARVWGDSPIVFTSSLGFARFFGKYHIFLQHIVLLYLSFIVPLLFISICFWMKLKRNKIINNISLATFKITLVVFYAFIDVPYLYLFYTSSFVSLIAIAYFISNEKELVAVR